MIGMDELLVSAAAGGCCVVRRAALLAGGLSGLMLANHFASALLWIVPLSIFFVWQAKQARAASGFALAVLALVPGLSLYAYLPLRAGFGPLLNWGDPRTWQQFWWMLSRGGYSQAQLASYEGLAEAQVAFWWKSLGQMGLAWCFSLSLVGAWAMWTTRKGLSVTVGSAILLTLYAALIVNKTPPENQWLVLIFALPATALLAPLAGVGLASLQGEENAVIGYLGLGVAVAMGLWLALGNVHRADRSGSYIAWDYAHDLALSMPRDSLYMAEGDYHVLPLLHLQAVEGKRPDVLAMLNVLSGDAWYQKLLQQRDPKLLLPAVGPAEKASLELAALNARTRPLRIGPFSALMSPQTLGVPIHQVGLLRGLGASETSRAQSLAWAARPPARQGTDLEKVEADLLPWYTVALVQEGNEAISRHQPKDAISAYRRALARPGPKPDGPLAYNLGLAYEEAGRRDLALLAYQHGIDADPNFKPAAERIQRLIAKP